MNQRMSEGNCFQSCLCIQLQGRITKMSLFHLDEIFRKVIFFLNSAMNNDVQIMSAHVLYALTYLAVSAHSFNYCRDHI